MSEEFNAGFWWQKKDPKERAIIMKKHDVHIITEKSIRLMYRAENVKV